jgi:hypothetical protein
MAARRYTTAAGVSEGGLEATQDNMRTCSQSSTVVTIVLGALHVLDQKLQYSKSGRQEPWSVADATNYFVTVRSEESSVERSTNSACDEVVIYIQIKSTH